MIRFCTVLLILLCTQQTASAVALKKATDLSASLLAPHRAVYEITLADRREGISISDVSGRMVFEITGSPCDGYTQNMRMVTRITDEAGKETVSDLRSSTWEEGNGGRFRFTSSHYFDSNLQEMVSGSARRDAKKGKVTVKIKRPGDAELSLAGGALFPTQHSLALLKIARQGGNALQAHIYDGSEQGKGYYRTFAFIGDRQSPGSDKRDRKPADARRLKKFGLGRLASWPIAISYFDKDAKGDSVPSYELSFRLYPNGVSRKLLINYGDFSVRGRLDKITYLSRTACQ